MKCKSCKAPHTCSKSYCSRSDQGSGEANGYDWHTCHLRNCGETWKDTSLCKQLENSPQKKESKRVKQEAKAEPKFIPGERGISLNIETRVYFDGLTRSERPTGRIRGSGDWFPVPLEIIEKLTRGLDLKY